MPIWGSWSLLTQAENSAAGKNPFKCSERILLPVVGCEGRPRSVGRLARNGVSPANDAELNGGRDHRVSHRDQRRHESSTQPRHTISAVMRSGIGSTSIGRVSRVGDPVSRGLIAQYEPRWQGIPVDSGVAQAFEPTDSMAAITAEVVWPIESLNILRRGAGRVPDNHPRTVAWKVVLTARAIDRPDERLVGRADPHRTGMNRPMCGSFTRSSRSSLMLSAKREASVAPCGNRRRLRRPLSSSRDAIRPAASFLDVRDLHFILAGLCG